MENRKYTLLIIALYCYSGHVKAVINHLKEVNPLVDVTLLTNDADEYTDVATEGKVKLERYDVPPVRIKWRWLMNFIIRRKQCKFFAEFARDRQYDIVNVHFPNMFMSFVYPYLRAMSNNLVITPWGSDVLRRDKKYLRSLESLYQRADYVATAQKTPLGERIVQDLHVEPQKMVGNFFGSDLIDYALKNGNSISTDDAKMHFGLSGKFVITCGYNRREPQRHKTIINAIDQVRNRLPNNLTLLFPMQYGAETRPEYLEECKKECEIRNLPALFVTRYLPVEELYLLRMATDVFVHVQTTDASSGSVQEYILCDKKIVHGSWIKYDELEAYLPLFYFPVNKIEDLGEVIVQACNSDKISVPQEVLDIVRNRGWERNAHRMNDFFLSLV